MLNSFRTSIGNWLLKRKSGTVIRNRAMINLTGATSIGILYPLYDLPDYNKVEAFVSGLQKKNKELRVLGYLQHKDLATRFLPKLSYDFFFTTRCELVFQASEYQGARFYRKGI